MDLLKVCQAVFALPFWLSREKARMDPGLPRIGPALRKPYPDLPGHAMARQGLANPAGMRAVSINNYIPNVHRLI
jgi:hypothetical protein